MELFSTIVGICGGITAIITMIVLIIKPIREKLLGTKQIREGQKCLLRNEMLRIYFRSTDDKKIRQYEFENFMLMYAAYKALDGNSFADKIKDEIKTWEVVS